tara:strand:+ start:179 stop:397 length:219 start_codon:yes stop_codon:yes gene_type:complete
MSKSNSKTCIVCGIKLNDEYEKLENNVFYCKECYQYHLSLLNNIPSIFNSSKKLKYTTNNINMKTLKEKEKK